MKFEKRILMWALAIGLPGTLAALFLLWTGEYLLEVRWTVTLLLAVLWFGFAGALRHRVVRPLQTIANQLKALREGDFSIRARNARPDDALGLVLLEANALGATLRRQRLGAMEAAALLETVMEEIDVAIFAFDHRRRLKLVNRAGTRVLGAPAERLLDRDAEDLGLDHCLRGDVPRTLNHAFPGRTARWELRRGGFRQDGEPHHLLVLSDLSKTLREEERQAWRRLIRVLGHEINNSLAPIHSIAETLETLLRRDTRQADWEEDMREGLGVIGGRAGALNRFMASYARLARLPPPEPAPLNVAAWVYRVTALETRLDVVVRPGPNLTIRADADQLDQLLINLVRNAADAALETGGGVTVAWRRRRRVVEVLVEDEGPGIPETANLFVPFFTTKPHGSGIGLALARQITEGHEGTLTLENRADSQGCVATLRLPSTHSA